jgi:hypothetical protein
VISGDTLVDNGGSVFLWQNSDRYCSGLNDGVCALDWWNGWPACGVGGIFSEYGSPPDHARGWIVPTRLTFFQNNVWPDNVYDGPPTFCAWNRATPTTRSAGPGGQAR